MIKLIEQFEQIVGTQHQLIVELATKEITNILMPLYTEKNKLVDEYYSSLEPVEETTVGEE
jgi:hypothetical protein